MNNNNSKNYFAPVNNAWTQCKHCEEARYKHYEVTTRFGTRLVCPNMTVVIDDE